MISSRRHTWDAPRTCGRQLVWLCRSMTNARDASSLADALRAVSLGAGVFDDHTSDESPVTDSESDWSDAELREADCTGTGAPPSAAQGMGRPWAHVARKRRSRIAARVEANAMRFQGAVGDAEGGVRDGAGGVFLSDLDASAASHVLACLLPVDRARVAATRNAERVAMSHRGYTPSSPRSTPSGSVSVTPVGSVKNNGADFGSVKRNGAGFGGRVAGDLSADAGSPNMGNHGSHGNTNGNVNGKTNGNVNGSNRSQQTQTPKGHLASVAWREVNLRGAATSTALESLRNVACGSVKSLDVTGSRGVKRGELLALVMVSPKLRTLKASHLGDTGKFSCKDCELFINARPSLTKFECDVGVSAAKVKDKDGNFVSGSALADLARVLVPGGPVVAKRLKIHGADANEVKKLAALAANAAAGKTQRVFSLDISWGLKLACGACEGVALACEREGRGWPFTRLGMRKANIKCPGAQRLALAIKRASARVDRWEKQKEWSRRKLSKPEDGHGETGGDDFEGMFAVDGEDTNDEEEEPSSGVSGACAIGKQSRDSRTTPDLRKPTCRLRWLDLGSNLIGEIGASAIGNALTSNVPITRLSLRDNPLGVEACFSLGAALSRCCTLRRIDLAHCGFGDPGVVAFCAGIMSDPTFVSSSRSTSLRVLQLGFNNIGEAGINALVEVYNAGKLHNLEHLDLACNVLGPTGTAALAGLLTAQTSFDDDETRKQHDDSSDDDENETSAAHTTTQTTRKPSRRGGLYSLDLAVNNVSVTVTGEGETTGERFGVRKLLNALERNKTLRQLNLRGNDLTPQIAGDVAEMLLENTSLTMVNVGYNKIYNEGVWELAEALSENVSLIGLDLQRNEISDEGAAHVQTLMKANSQIGEVDMRSNMLSPETVVAFGDVFGSRVNCQWQQEPPKVDKTTGKALVRRVADGFGGGVVARREAKKAAKNAKKQ